MLGLLLSGNQNTRAHTNKPNICRTQEWLVRLSPVEPNPMPMYTCGEILYTHMFRGATTFSESHSHGGSHGSVMRALVQERERETELQREQREMKTEKASVRVCVRRVGHYPGTRRTVPGSIYVAREIEIAVRCPFDDGGPHEHHAGRPLRFFGAPYFTTPGGRGHHNSHPQLPGYPPGNAPPNPTAGAWCKFWRRGRTLA